MKSFRLAFAALTVSLLLSIGLNVVLSFRLMRPAEQPKAMPYQPANPAGMFVLSLDDLTSAALENPSLLQLARSKDYSGAGQEGKRAMVRDWSSSKFSSLFDRMEAGDQDKFVQRLEKELDDMLAEREFER